MTGKAKTPKSLFVHTDFRRGNLQLSHHQGMDTVNCQATLPYKLLKQAQLLTKFPMSYTSTTASKSYLERQLQSLELAVIYT